jgi:deoxyribodipyrimidine photolyase-related protein
LAKAGVEKIVYCDTADNWLEKRLREASAKCGIKLLQLESPNFICSKDYLQRYFNGKRKYFLTSFYTEQRLRFNILVDKKKPLGGKWTFDTENRKKNSR